MQDEAEPVGVEDLEEGTEADPELSSIGFSSVSIDAPRSTVSGNVRAPSSNSKTRHIVRAPPRPQDATHDEEQFSADLFERLHTAK